MAGRLFGCHSECSDSETKNLAEARLTFTQHPCPASMGEFTFDKNGFHSAALKAAAVFLFLQSTVLIKTYFSGKTFQKSLLLDNLSAYGS